ncbi:MAG: ribosome-associated heat shock protein Hsp15 [Saprospiraceae bacterium]
MEKVRIDKWLWSVRIFKSRSISSDACKGNKVKIGDKTLKPSYLVRVGEHVQVFKEGFNLTFEVVALINKRVSATLAQPCYKNLTPEEELNKYKDWFVGKGAPERRERGAGRPTKRERRDIEGFKDDSVLWDDDVD